MDQSRFDKIHSSHRTLAFQGESVVRASVGQVNATSHSYMIYPIITMAGDLLFPVYVLVSEATGKFPASKPADPWNIRSYAGKTANMSKLNFETFYEEVFWPSVSGIGDTLFLLVDSWTPNKDDRIPMVNMPPGKTLIKRLISRSTTGLAQPENRYFFRPLKNFVKYFTDTNLTTEDWNVWHRDVFFNLQSLALYQFSASLFKPMIRFAFYSAGYSSEEPEPFQTPVQYCFDSVLPNVICIRCDGIPFMRCAHCTNCYCIDHCIKIEVHKKCTNEL